MLNITKNEKYLILVYSIDGSYYDNTNWVIVEFSKGNSIGFKNNAIRLTPELLINNDETNEDSESEDFLEVSFRVGEFDDDSGYYKLYRGVILDDRDIYFHKDYEPDIRHFIVETNISVLRQISELISGDIVIGGDRENSLPFEAFYNLINSFPTTYEKRIYAQARISSILKNYFEKVKDVETVFKKYRNKQGSKEGIQLLSLFKEYEAEKYQTILDKLRMMLVDEDNYNETVWQKEIIDILLLLYPKYIAVFDAVTIRADEVKDKQLDYLFVDANGHIDIVEIKQPFENAIMTKGLYRGNYIPLRELSGTVMQLEKYIYYLNRWGKAGEKTLLTKYASRLPVDFEIHITNPKGFIIMGRENNLSNEQKKDFEVVKRKYRSIIDILSYDDLIRRLEFMIEQIKKH